MKKQRYLESESLSAVLFILLFVMYAVVYMTKSMFSSAMAVIVEEGIMTKSQTGLINAVFWLVYAPFQVVGGFAADKYSPYKLVVIGLMGAVISNIIIYFNQSYYERGYSTPSYSLVCGRVFSKSFPHRWHPL